MVWGNFGILFLEMLNFGALHFITLFVAIGPLGGMPPLNTPLLVLVSYGKNSSDQLGGF